MDNEKEQTLLKTLEHSVTVIRQWHDMNAMAARRPKEIIEELWHIYYNHAPEMKLIREAINELKNE